MKNKNIIFALAVLFIFLIGLGLRMYGILDDHSFWSDEAYVSHASREVISGNTPLATGLWNTRYQPLQTIVTMLSFVLLGASEYAARLPVVLFGALGIVGAYLLAKKYSNVWGGLIAAFVYAFSQLNLANATQAKPYAIIQTATVFSFYLLTQLKDSPRKRFRLHALIIAINIAATLFHFIGVLIWVPYITYLLLEHRREILTAIRRPAHTLLLLAAVTALFFLFQGKQMIYWFIYAGPGNLFFTFNHMTYLRELLWKQYAFITLPALFGMLLCLKTKYGNIAAGIILYLAVTAYLWTFKNYTHNIRYLVPLFGVIFVCFGVFWGTIAEKLFGKKAFLVAALIVVLLYVGGNKLIRKPSVYYSPNADLLADVQNANYKDAYAQLERITPEDEYVIYNDTTDSQSWYMKGRLPDALFMRHETLGLPHGGKTRSLANGVPIYTSLDQFKKLMQKHPKGFLVVEDWHSFLPEEIKEYAKKNLRLEVRVEGLPQAGGDNWPIEIYSFGIK